MADELAKVIANARLDYERRRHSGFKYDLGTSDDFIAAAVAAHLASKEPSHRARKAVSGEIGCAKRTPCFFDDGCMCWAIARAAIRAAVGDESTARARRG